MAGLVPAIHVFGHHVTQDVDARHEAGHDGVMKEPSLRRMSRYGNEPRAFFGAFCPSNGFSGCCRSSVVEHSLGKGEVESSILSGSTSSPTEINHALQCHGQDRYPLDSSVADVTHLPPPAPPLITY